MDYKNKAYPGCLKYQRNQINLMLAGGLKITHQNTYTYLKGTNRSKISKKYTKYAYVFIQCFLYQWPALFQVSLPVFGEQSCKTALLRESSGVVLFGKSWFLPTIGNSKKFWFIYRKKCTHQILIYFWTFICMHLQASSTLHAFPLPMLFSQQTTGPYHYRQHTVLKLLVHISAVCTELCIRQSSIRAWTLLGSTQFSTCLIVSTK